MLGLKKEPAIAREKLFQKSTSSTILARSHLVPYVKQDTEEKQRNIKRSELDPVHCQVFHWSRALLLSVLALTGLLHPSKKKCGKCFLALL
jgi:hypothetical protein